MATHVVKVLADVNALAAAAGDTIFCKNPCKIFKCTDDKLKVSIKAIKLDNGLYADLDMERMTDPSMTIVGPKDPSEEYFPGQFSRLKNHFGAFYTLKHKNAGERLLASRNAADMNSEVGHMGTAQSLLSATNLPVDSGVAEEGNTEMVADEYFWSNVSITGIESLELPSTHKGCRLIFTSGNPITVTKIVDIAAGVTNIPFAEYYPLTQLSTVPSLYINFTAGFKALTSGSNTITFYKGTVNAVGDTVSPVTKPGMSIKNPIKIYTRLQQTLTIDD